MNEPYVRVGILSAENISFELFGIYSTSDNPIVTGKNNISISESGIGLIYNGVVYESLEFIPTSYDGDCFEFENVTIGVDFHWEQKECQRFRGNLKLVVNNNKITVINVIKVEDYLESVISSEMKGTSSLPLLQAHAVISRSWLLKQMQSKSVNYRKSTADFDKDEIIRWWNHDDHTEFDVCADDHCQRYQGITRIMNNTAKSAVADTAGQVLMCDGEICDARFSKCCGGVFERFESCWEDEPHPYLTPRRDNTDDNDYPDLSIESNAIEWIKSKPDSFCATSDNKILSQVLNLYDLERHDFYRWNEHYSRQQLSKIINTKLGANVGEIIDFKVIERGSSGRIIRLQLIGTKRSVVIGKELMIRRVLSDTHLLSSAFVVERHFNSGENLPDSFTLHGAGWGHGVGLCQIGAAVMGERGYSYDEILQHYYPGTYLNKIY